MPSRRLLQVQQRRKKAEEVLAQFRSTGKLRAEEFSECGQLEMLAQLQLHVTCDLRPALPAALDVLWCAKQPSVCTVQCTAFKAGTCLMHTATASHQRPCSAGDPLNQRIDKRRLLCAMCGQPAMHLKRCAACKQVRGKAAAAKSRMCLLCQSCGLAHACASTCPGTRALSKQCNATAVAGVLLLARVPGAACLLSQAADAGAGGPLKAGGHSSQPPIDLPCAGEALEGGRAQGRVRGSGGSGAAAAQPLSQKCSPSGELGGRPEVHMGCTPPPHRHIRCAPQHSDWFTAQRLAFPAMHASLYEARLPHHLLKIQQTCDTSTAIKNVSSKQLRQAMVVAAAACLASG